MLRELGCATSRARRSARLEGVELADWRQRALLRLRRDVRRALPELSVAMADEKLAHARRPARHAVRRRSFVPDAPRAGGAQARASNVDVRHVAERSRTGHAVTLRERAASARSAARRRDLQRAIGRSTDNMDRRWTAPARRARGRRHAARARRARRAGGDRAAPELLGAAEPTTSRRAGGNVLLAADADGGHGLHRRPRQRRARRSP